MECKGGFNTSPIAYSRNSGFLKPLGVLKARISEKISSLRSGCLGRKVLRPFLVASLLFVRSLRRSLLAVSLAGLRAIVPADVKDVNYIC